MAALCLSVMVWCMESDHGLVLPVANCLHSKNPDGPVSAVTAVPCMHDFCEGC